MFFSPFRLYTVDGVIVTKPKYFKDDRAIFVLVPMHGCFIHAPYGKVIVTEPQISDPKATKLASSAASLEERKPCIKSKSYESSSTLPEFKSSNDRLNKAVKKYVAGLVMDPCNENNSLQEPFGNIWVKTPKFSFKCE